MLARTNPFRTERLHALTTRLRGTTWPDLLDRLAAHGWRGAVVGPEGHGKSTLLRELGQRLEAAEIAVVRSRAHPDKQWLADGVDELRARVTPETVVLLDSADALGLRGWRRVRNVTASARGLVVTVHRPRLLPTLHRCETDLPLLRDLVSELTNPSAVPNDVLAALHRRHRGNVRACLLELYDSCATRPDGEPH